MTDAVNETNETNETRLMIIEITSEKSKNKCVFAVDPLELDITKFAELNKQYPGAEDRLKDQDGNIITATLDQIGNLLLNYIDSPMVRSFHKGPDWSVLLKLIQDGTLESTWPVMNGQEGLGLIYIGPADNSLDDIIKDHFSEDPRPEREVFVERFNKAFERIKESAIDDKLVLTPVRVSPDGKIKFVTKFGVDYTELTADKLLRVWDTTPTDVLETVAANCGWGDFEECDPVDLLMVTISRVVETYFNSGDQEPWEILGKNPPWGWPKFGEGLGIYLFEMKGKLPTPLHPKVTNKNISSLVKRIYLDAKLAMSKLH